MLVGQTLILVNVNSVRPNVNTGRVNVNSVRSNVNTGRTNVNPVRPTVNTGSSNVNTVRSRQPVPTKTSNSFSPKRPQDHPLQNMVDRGTDSLEKDLKQTKLTMGSAIVKLVKKVKKLEAILKRRNVVLSDSKEEEPEAQGRKSQDDPLFSL
ncbi:hypothetical protein Tco_1180735, partial [Tanacetum coccineum]